MFEYRWDNMLAKLTIFLYDFITIG